MLKNIFNSIQFSIQFIYITPSHNSCCLGALYIKKINKSKEEYWISLNVTVLQCTFSTKP